MQKYLKTLHLLFSALLTLYAGSSYAVSSFEVLKTLPIQHGGRIEPLDTFSKDVVRLITGKSSFQGIEAIEVIISWLADSSQWVNKPIIEVSLGELKQKLNLPKTQKHFSYQELIQLSSLQQYGEEVFQKNQREEKLSPCEQAMDRLSIQLLLFEKVSQGELWTIVPHPKNHQEIWISLTQLKDLPQSPNVEELAVTLHGMLTAYSQKDWKTFQLTSLKMKQILSEFSKDPGYPYSTTLGLEVFYNDFHPFRKAWILYLIAGLGFVVYLLSHLRLIKYLSSISLALALSSHLLGFYLRCTVTGRPPVGTMYESVVWVSLGIMIFSFFIAYQFRNVMALLLGCFVASVGLILADQFPLLLDPSLKPLAPVLRSNFWLTIHVLTITLSYAAFALAMGIGNWALFKFIIKPSSLSIHTLVQMIYRTMQIGVLLLTAGTILGGVWADYSWGRFWGWDPKEVWALIALLLYLVIVHGKYAGWLRDFGVACGAVLAFQGVLTAWYGVNFVMGVGLHSYGFGTGGIGYVLSYCFIEIGIVILAWIRYQSHKAHYSPHNTAVQ